MKTFKFFTIVVLSLFLFTSCDKEEQSQIVFYSVDDLKQDFKIQFSNIDGAIEPISRSVVVNLTSSKVFADNIDLLKDIEVKDISFKVKCSNTNLPSNMSNIAFFLDEVKLTQDDFNFDSPEFLKKEASFSISNEEILSVISSKLLQKKQVVISYYLDVKAEMFLDLDLELSITSKGTFID